MDGALAPVVDGRYRKGEVGGTNKYLEVPSINYVSYNAVVMHGEEFRYGGAHVAWGDDREG